MDPRELLVLILLRVANMLRIRDVPRFGASTYPFTDYFRGFERVGAVRRLFGDRTEEVLLGLRVEFTWIPGYMFVSGVDGHLVVNTRYMNGGDRVDVYLDVIHELVHVRQLMDGRELFDVNYGYVDRPTEVEAYQVVVREARRLGLSDERICDYLKTGWMSEDDLKRLARAVNVEC